MDVVTTLQRLREQRPEIFTSQVMKGRSRERGRIERNEGKKERREGRSKKKKKMRKRKWEEGKG